MGLLNFRKKNKKNDVLKDSLPKLTCESDISDSTGSATSQESYSSVVNSFMTVSSISDITSSSLLDEILNELPLPKKNTGNETSGRNIRHSLNLSSNRSNNNIVKNSNTKETNGNSNGQNVPFTRGLHSVASHHMLKGPHTIPKIKTDTHSTDFSNSSDESESDSLSIDSLLTTEDSVPFPISWSDSRFSPGFIAKKQEDTTPLMELISRSYAANGVTSTKGLKATKSNPVFSDDIDASQRSSVFAIDRMKERHRQEYRRSINFTPSVAESKLLVSQRNTSKAETYTHRTSNQDQQKIHATGVVNDQTGVQLIINDEARSGKVTPKKSFSTNTNSQFGAFINGNVTSNPMNTRTVAVHSINQPVKQKSGNFNESNSKFHSISSNVTQNRNKLSTSNSNRILPSVYNISNVPHVFNTSGKSFPIVKENFAKRYLQQNFSCPTSNRSKHFGQDNTPFIPTIQEEKYTSLNNSVIQKSMETAPKLRKEYRRMQQIHKYKYYSVPNLQHLQDNGKLEKSIQATNVVDTKIINDRKNYNQRAEKIQSKNIYDVGDDKQHYNKFIYRYYRSSQQPHKKCYQRQSDCYSKCLDKPQRHDNHQVKTRGPRKPLLLLTPFEPSSAKYQDSQQHLFE